MALARIISSSPLCSRELALNLLERGYAVEIVSPDAIPDNLADLELRVETGPADILIANVAARGDARSATLEFVHQLKSPSLDMRRPVMAAGAPSVSEEIIPDITIPALAISANPSRAIVPCEPIPVSTSALAPAIKPRIVEEPKFVIEPVMKPVIVEKAETIVGAPANPAADAPSADPPKKPSAFSEGASLILMPSPSVEVAQEVVQHAESDVAIPVAAVFKVIIPKPSLPSVMISKFQWARWRSMVIWSLDQVRRTAVRPAGWFGWTALGFAGLIALGFSLELISVRMSHPPHDSVSRVATGNTTAADGSSLPAPILDANESNSGEKEIKSPVSSQSSIGSSVALPSELPVFEKNTDRSLSASGSAEVRSSPKTSKSVHRSTRVRHFDDLIAPDTITYFNRPGAKPVPVTSQPARQHDSRKRGEGVIAANSTSAKTASQTGSDK